MVTKAEMRKFKEEAVDYIYILVDPRDSALRYVGRTYFPKLRLEGHIADARQEQTANSRKKEWINDLVSQGINPLLVVIEEADQSISPLREAYWVNLLIENGADLLNGVRCLVKST